MKNSISKVHVRRREGRLWVALGFMAKIDTFASKMSRVPHAVRSRTFCIYTILTHLISEIVCLQSVGVGCWTRMTFDMSKKG